MPCLFNTFRVEKQNVNLYRLTSLRRDPINLAVLHLKETGELEKLQIKWWYDKTECKNDRENSSSQANELSLTNLAGVFYILIGGLLVALVISLFQFCFKREKSTTTTSLTSNSLQMTDSLKPKSRLPPITSARDYDNGQVSELICGIYFVVAISSRTIIFCSITHKVHLWNIIPMPTL
jgi:hypothetical protein